MTTILNNQEINKEILTRNCKNNLILDNCTLFSDDIFWYGKYNKITFKNTKTLDNAIFYGTIFNNLKIENSTLIKPCTLFFTYINCLNLLDIKYISEDVINMSTDIKDLQMINCDTVASYFTKYAKFNTLTLNNIKKMNANSIVQTEIDALNIKNMELNTQNFTSCKIRKVILNSVKFNKDIFEDCTIDEIYINQQLPDFKIFKDCTIGIIHLSSQNINKTYINDFKYDLTDFNVLLAENTFKEINANFNKIKPKNI